MEKVNNIIKKKINNNYHNHLAQNNNRNITQDQKSQQDKQNFQEQYEQDQITSRYSEEEQDLDQSAKRQFIIRRKKRSIKQNQQNLDSIKLQSIKDIVKISEKEIEIESEMNSSNNPNNLETNAAGENHCSQSYEGEKDITSEGLIQQSQPQYEEDDIQICEFLQQAQELKENLQHDEAEKVYFDVLNLQKQKYGNNSNQVASTYKKLASMFQKKKDYEASLKYYNESLAIFQCQDGQSHTSREATCLISMSNIYLLKQNTEEAQHLVTSALHIYNTQVLEDEQMKPLLISQALRLKRKIDMHEKQKQYEEKQIAFSQEQTVCSICLDDIQKNKRVRQLNCGHVYHIKCIAQWLQLNSKCPYCRDVLPKPH